MAKLLRPSDRLKLLLAGLGDLFEDVAGFGGLIPAAYQQLYGFFPRRYRKSNFTHLVWRSLKAEEIQKVKINGIPHLRLTSKSKKEINRNFPLLALQNRFWDGLFTQCSYDIEEVNKRTRDVWRAKIQDLNFGQFQKSVYISPFDFSQDLWEFISQKNLQRNVSLARIKFVGINPKEIASATWPLNKLAKQYQKIINRFEKELEEKKVPLEQVKREFLSDYLNILFEDPLLPSELLPVNWVGFGAKKIAQKITKTLI